MRPPDPHPSGVRPPRLPARFVPRHVAIVMDGNGRWARSRGMARTEGHGLGVRVAWAGRRPRLWASVLRELQAAEEQTRDNTVITLQLCLNYGGRAEIADAARAIGRDVRAGRLNPDRVDERTLQRYLYHPELGDVDLFIRTSGEQRTSNFLLWQSAYAELVFSDKLWPDWDRRDLWAAVEQYARRDRRFGGVRA